MSEKPSKNPPSYWGLIYRESKEDFKVGEIAAESIGGVLIALLTVIWQIGSHGSNAAEIQLDWLPAHFNY
jgi:hypothetical protein